MEFRNNTYFKTPKDVREDRIQVEIGDSKQSQSFYPQMKLMRWDNEVNLSVRFIDSFPGEAIISQKDEKIKWIKPKIESHFYDHPVSEKYPEGGFEFEIVLKEKPSSNKLQFSIQTKNLDFFYQTPLTQKAIDEGHKRPENVIGSYAIYHSRKNGDYSPGGDKNYRAGKAFHIYRPKIHDAVEKETWGELSINVAKELLEISIDQNFLDNAIYPITIDPNFGFEGIGGTTGSTSADRMYGSLFTSPSNVLTAISLSIYSKYVTSEMDLKGILVLHSNLNIVENGVGDPVALGATADWKTSPFSIPPDLSKNTGYVLMTIGNGSWTRYWDTGDTNQGHTDTSNNYITPTNPTDATEYTEKFSIYCTYTAPTFVNISDSISFADSIIDITANIPILDGLSLSDSLLISNEFSLSDSISLGDLVIIGEPKDIADILNLNDEILREFYISIVDGISFSENLIFRKGFVIVNVMSPITTHVDVISDITKIITVDSTIE